MQTCRFVIETINPNSNSSWARYSKWQGRDLVSRPKSLPGVPRGQAGLVVANNRTFSLVEVRPGSALYRLASERLKQAGLLIIVPEKTFGRFCQEAAHNAGEELFAAIKEKRIGYGHREQDFEGQWLEEFATYRWPHNPPKNVNDALKDFAKHTFRKPAS